MAVRTALFIGVCVLSAGAQGSTDTRPVEGASEPAQEPFVQWADPPGAASPEEEELLRRAKGELASGKADVSEILTSKTYASIHARTEFRDLIAAHAKAAPLDIRGADEPGTRLTMVLEFADRAGAPVADALVYAYHTSAKGWYSDKGAHIRATSGDVKHARLFGYVRTDKHGRAEIRTIRPAGYPRSELPSHIHLGLTVDGKAIGVGEVRFADDPRMTETMRRQSVRDGDVIVQVEADAGGSQKGRARFTVDVPARRPESR